MSKFIIENPWNDFLGKYVLNKKEKQIKDLIVLKTDENIHLLQSLPGKFQRLKDLVLCDCCKVIVAKRNSVFHTKNHNGSNNLFLPYNAFPPDDGFYISSRSKTTINTAASNGKSTHSSLVLKDKKRKIINKSKPSKHMINVNKITNITSNDIIKSKSQEGSTNFTAETILNSSDPLKLKIRLHPKSSSPEMKIRQQNGNIFDNLNNYCNDIRNKPSVNNTVRVRSVDELLRGDDYYYRDNEDKKSAGVFASNGDKMIRSVVSAENIQKIRRITPDDVEIEEEWPTTRMSTSSTQPSAIPIISKRVIPIRHHHPTMTTTTTSSHNFHHHPPITASSVPLSSSSNSQSVLNQPPSQSNEVFQRFTNRIIRINGQRKSVRIQQVDDKPTNWQLSSSEKNSTIYHNQEATQKEFQRRLLQQGMISENDIIKCNRSSIQPDSGQRRKITILNGSLQSKDSCIQVIRRTAPVANNSGSNIFRVIESHNYRLPIQSVGLNQKNMVYNRVIIDKNNSLSLPQQSVVQNSKSWSCQNMSNVELSDEEFLLDSQYPIPSNSNNFTSSMHNVASTPQYHSNLLINESNAHLSTIKTYQKSDPEIFSRSYRKDEADDPSIHFLPSSPEGKIVHLPWDI